MYMVYLRIKFSVDCQLMYGSNHALSVSVLYGWKRLGWLEGVLDDEVVVDGVVGR